MSKFRSTVSQLCGALPYTCLRFTYGLAVGFQMKLLAELYKESSEIRFTLDQLTWLESLSFLGPIGSVTTGLAMQHFGNRVAAFFTAFMFITAFLLYYCSRNAAMIFTSRLLTDLTASNVLSTSCISEISEPRLRSKLLATCPMSVIFGTFFCLLLGNFLYWRNVALVDLFFPILVAIAIFFTPDSPTWLANKGRLDEAEMALCWLRGWVQPDQVQDEFKNLRKLKSSSSERKLDAQLVSFRSFFQIFFKRSFYLPLGKMCLLLFLYCVNGVDVVHNYSAIIFPRLQLPLATPVATVIVESASVVGNLAILVLVGRIGKRKLALYSLGIVALCHMLIAVIGFFKLQGVYSWISLVAIIVVYCVNSAGTYTVVYMLVSEIFPASNRYIGTAFSLSFSTLVDSVLKKTFLYIVDAITLPGMFIIFALLDIVALVTYYFIFPETEGKSLEEIADHFNSTKGQKEGEKISVQ